MTPQPPSFPDWAVDHVPQIFTLAGLLLLTLAAYMSGSDQLTCTRAGTRVDCHLQLLRWLSVVTVERRDIPDVVKTAVHTTSESRGTGVS